MREKNSIKKQSNHRRETIQLKRYIWLLIIVWTVIIFTSMFWCLYHVKKSTEQTARAQARDLFQMALLFRRWNSMQGGVYVPVTENTKPNPYLDVPERDIQLPSGRQMTLINPAYMTRQIHELQAEQDGILGHITSLNPIRAENAADPWETAALQMFEQGKTEVSSIQDINRVSYMRLMRPLLTEASCLRCHSSQGYQLGDIRGGISVAVPMSPLLAIVQKTKYAHIMEGILVWLIGLLGIVIGGLRIGKGIRERGRVVEELQESNSRQKETLTELKETQKKMILQERLAAVGQLSAGISHDFNNMLASIAMYTQMSLCDSELSPNLRKRLEIIDGQTDRAAKLVEQVLDFSRQSVIKRRALAAEPMVKEVVKLLVRTLPENIRIDLEIQSRDCIINADPSRIQQVIMNLALNARDAMPDGGKLHIVLSRVESEQINCVDCGPIIEGGWLQISVTDTGAGIPADVLPHIFEPFFTTKAPRGHGLGLAQILGIVEQHEGHIEVETVVGSGTTFIIYWPVLSEPELKVQTLENIEMTQTGGETILVVEDDGTVRVALVDVLKMLGYQVLEAADGQQALNLCERHKNKIALIISDWVMPVMSGLQLFRKLKERDIEVKFLMLTGYPLDIEAKKTVPEGIVGWIQKPPKLEQLAKTIAQALNVSGSTG